MSQWLKSVVLVILIATFVDLLLPNRSMQRYVKTVMSLFLLMTLLQPLLALLRTDSAIEEKLAAALLEPQAVRAGGQMATLESVRSQGQALQERQREEANRLVRSQAAELIKRQVERQAPVGVQSVLVETEPDGQGQPVIRKVILAIEETAPQPAPPINQQPAAMEAIKPMEPIAPPADVRIGQGTASAPQSYKARQPERLSGEQQQLKTQITRMLEQEWQLQPEQVELTIEPARGR
ncbi:stage III sporulation protein AF [Paenibacillus sp. UNCCL117]|uniref:stage III sporulation protein AF n=1 Tax=unclassified Paenibacillus TaxID=185978 RepID=UPI0008852CFA|nr:MULTISPECIES: stage III sporulation protein AF [unclassified Paenibacillus]SDD44023.1 stage III sporulation protein AF [Paenibacillus sp. cl123]SFW47225.1 stage III sporulation protein AF [Paenibacillus sp. UNCCL117]